MKTVVLASCTPEDQAMLDERRRLDQDRLDEVWRGEYHTNVAPGGRHGHLDDELAAVLRPRAKAVGLRSVSTINIGTPEDFRVPDHSFLTADQELVTWFPTAAIAIEIVSPGDESWRKFDFYAAHGVDEVVVADVDEQAVHWFVLRGDRYEAVQRSPLLALDVQEVVRAVDWP